MSAARKPGPQCYSNDPVAIDDGTTCRAPSPSPGSLGFAACWDPDWLAWNGVAPEPIFPYHETAGNGTRTSSPSGQASTTQPRLADIDTLIATIQREFPAARISITGRGRTVERQAELMAQRRRANRHQFLHTYRAAAHITAMDDWVTAHLHATEEETAAAFVEIINNARRGGAVVSNHLSDRARDISIPVGTALSRNRVRRRLQDLGAHVIDEHDAVGGPHWHVDY